MLCFGLPCSIKVISDNSYDGAKKAKQVQDGWYLLGFLKFGFVRNCSESATFRVRNVGGQSQLFIGLSEKFLGALCVAAELTIVRGLRLIDLLVGVDDILLRGTQVAVPLLMFTTGACT